MTQQFCAVDSVLAGHHDPRFSDLAVALAEELTTGGELGAAITVDIDGESVVDIWGGYADRAKPDNGIGTRSSTSFPAPRTSPLWRRCC